MNFVLFLLLNAVLLLRPEELLAFEGLHLYMILIVLCTTTSLPRLQELLSVASLRRRPIAVCVLLFFVATIVSLLARGRIDDALFDSGPDLAKVILYYFLLIAVVDTADRFRAFVVTLIVLISIVSIIALAEYHGFVDFPSIAPVTEKGIDPATGEETIIMRMVSSGVFNDPNDLCLLLGLGILSCVYCATTSPYGLLGRVCWLLPLPIYVYAINETHSRGGLLGVLAGGGAYVYSRYGGPKAFPFAVAGMVAVLAMLGGRQGNVTGGGTAHVRVMYWAEGMTTLFRHPYFIPIGLGQGWFLDEVGQVAHNSFIQAYVEIGLVGGGAFLGAFALGVRILDRLGRGVDAPSWAIQGRHYAFAALVGYAMGCYSLTRNVVIPTYLTIGIASVLLDKAAPTLPDKFLVNEKWFIRGVLFSICGLLLMKFATQGLGQAGI
jgi:putative inorganic carbon (hco3(-)) transporter